MIRFSPADVALEGFRLTRERPLAVLTWAAARLIYGVVTLYLLIGGGRGAAFNQLMTLSQSKTPSDPAALAGQMAPLIAQLAPALTVLSVISLVFYAVIYTAVLRSILRPADRAYAYLRLSMDEVRQFGLAVIIFAAMFVYAFSLSLVSQVMIIAASSLGQAALLVQTLVIMALIAGFIYPAVRLSLAPAMTFADGRITLFRSLPLTEKQFWPMLGAYGLAIALTVVVGLLAMVVFVFAAGALDAAANGLSNIPALLGLMQSDQMSLATLLTPIGVAKVVFNGLLTTLIYVIAFAPGAAIFRALSGRVGAPIAGAAKVGQPWG